MTFEAVPASAGEPHGGQFSAGVHVCWVVGEQDNFASAAAALLAQADRLAQRPVAFAPAGSALFTALKPKAALTADPAADILGGGPLDPAAMTGALRKQTALAREAGQRGVRLVADMDWLRPTRAEPAAIAAFETVLDRLAAELDATLICAYQRRSFPAAAISSALAVHSTARGHDADPPFQFISEGTRQWRLRGEIDFSVSRLVQAVFTAAAQLGDCTVDLHDLKSTDLSGMRAIVRAARNATAIELRNPPRVFRRYWQLCDFAQAAPNIHLDCPSAQHNAATSS